MYTFTISIRQIDKTRRVIAETQQPGVATGSRQEATFSLDVDSLSSIINDAEGQLEYGQRLGEAVFTQGIDDLLKQQRTRAEEANQRLHVLLSVEDESLKGLAWERLCTRNSLQRWQFLRLQQQTPYSLYIPSLTETRFPAITRVGLRALVVVVNHGPTRPYGLAEFDAAATVASLREALSGIPCTVLACDGDQIVPGADGLPTLDEICRQMTDAQHQLLHIVCHGARDRSPQPEGASADLISDTTSLIDLSESGTTTSLSLRESYLFLRTTKPAALDDPTKGVDRVKAQTFIDELAKLTRAKTLPHLTFLCSCQTATQESGASLEGLAQRLVRELGMPAVVAMTRPVSIPLAQSLATEFYRSFRKHGQPDVALVEACAGLASHGDVLVPNLYSRLGGRPLFSQDADLTNEEWDLGINELEERLPKHAPVLVPEVAPWISQTRQALVTRRRSLQSGDASPDLRNSLTVLNNAQAEFDRITREVLGHPFENLARGEAAETSITETVCPFPGLAVFDKEAGSDYRKYFFGRETETRELVAQIERQSFVVVLGGSGSGKSSLVRAGVLPELQSREPKPILLIMKPGMSPLAELERQQQATPDANLIFVDQFEEVFTQCTDIRQRKEFIDRLLELQGSGRVVLTMRVDFLGDCAAHDGLHRLLDTDDARHWKLLQPLAGERLRKVVEAQAKAANLQFEPGLLTEIFKDLGDEPGAMALLQHCMRQLWQYRHGPWLKRLRYNLDEREAAKYPDFKHVGGVKGAIARTADEVFETLQPAEQRQCEFLFDRLVLSDLQETDLEKRRLTRKRVDLTELTPAGGDQNFTRRLVDRLATARLLVVTREETDANPTADAGSVDSDSRSNITVAHAFPRTTEAKTLVEVTHEALIRSWTRLHRWLADAEITRKLRERINTDCKRYNDNPQPENLTLWGSVLEEAEQLANAVPAKLNQDESHFVSLCRSEESKKQKAKLAEAEEKQKAAEKIARLSIASGAILLLMLGVAGISIIYIRAARQDAKQKLVRMSTVSAIAARERNDIVTAAHQFMIAAENVDDFTKANQLRIAASRLIRPVALTARLSQGTVGGCTPLKGGKATLTWGQEGLKLWNDVNPQDGISMRHPGARVFGVDMMADESYVLAWDSKGEIRIWDLNSPSAAPMIIPHPSVLGGKFIRGNRLVSWSYDGTLQVSSIRNGQARQESLFQLEGNLNDHSVVVSPSTAWLFAWSDKDHLLVKLDDTAASRIDSFELPKELGELRGAKFLQDEQLAVWGDTSRIDLINPVEPEVAISFNTGGQVSGFDYVPSTLTLLAGTNQNIIEKWSLFDKKSPERVDNINHGNDPMEGSEVDLLTESLVTWDRTGAIRVWDVSGGSKKAEFEHPTLTGISTLPGSLLASWGNDGSAMIWDLSNTEPPNLVARLHHGSLIEEVTGWGKLIFTRSSESGTIKRWEIQQSGPQVIRHPGIAGFEVDRDGRIATWGQGPAETVGEFPSSIRITQLANPSNETQEVLFSDQLIGCDWLPSGKLISWSDNGKVRIYDEPFAQPIAEETLPGLFRLTLSVDRNNAIAICRQQRSIDINALAISEIGITRIGRFEVGQLHDARYRGLKELLICADTGIFHADLSRSEIEFNLRTPEGTKLRLGKFSSDGTKAIVAKDSGALALWHDGKLESIDATLSKDGPGTNLSVDGKHIIAWDRAQVLLIETTNRQISELPFHDRNTIGGIIGNNRILTWSENELRLSSLDDKSGITTMSHGGIGRYETAVAFSPDSRWIVSCGGKLAKLWDADNGDLLLQLRHSQDVKYSRFLNQDTLITLTDGDEAAMWSLTADKFPDVPAITGTFLDASGRLKVR